MFLAMFLRTEKGESELIWKEWKGEAAVFNLTEFKCDQQKYSKV